MKGVSAAIIVFNEEQRLPACLASLEGFEDVVVIVDSRTTDRSAKVAESFGCRVYVEEWRGFGPQKQLAVERCGNDWVLIIDADERLPAETKEAIFHVVESPKSDAYSFPRKNYLSGRWIRHGGWWPDRVVRLVDRRKGRFHGAIHERWVTEGALDDKLPYPIEHRSFSDYSEMLWTLDEYSTAVSKDLFASGKRANALTAIFHGCGMFFRTYFLRLGFLDGFDGFVIALMTAGGSFFKYAKLIEMKTDR